MALHRVSWCKLRLRALTRARTPWPPLLLLMLSALCHILCQAVVVANAKLPDSLDETVLPPPPPPPETLAAAWPNAEDPLTPTAPATASLVMATALRLVPAVTDFNSFLALLFLAIFIAALIFLLVFHVTLNWRPFQKYGRTGSGKGNNALTTTGESSDCQLTPATPTASSPLPSDRTSHLHPYPHPSLPVNATTSSCLPCVCFRPLCCCCTSCDFFCCLAPPIQPVTTASAAKTACSHFSPTLSRDIKAADSVSTFFQQDHTTPTNGSDPQISPPVPATPPHCDNGFTGCEPALPTSHLPQPVPVGALSQRRMISVPSLSQLSQVGQPEHVQPLGFDGGQLAAALPLADISAGSFNGGVATSGFLHLRSAAVCVIPQQGGVASAPRTPLFSQSAVVGLHRLSTISASLSDVASASAAAQTAELSTDSKAVLGRSADEVGAPAADHRRPKPAMPFLPSSANSVAADSASFDALKRSFTTSGASRGPKRSLLESVYCVSGMANNVLAEGLNVVHVLPGDRCLPRTVDPAILTAVIKNYTRRGSHTSLTLVLSPTISSSHATLQPSMPNSYGVHGPTSFLAPRGHRTTRFSPMAAATTSPVSLHRPCGAAGDADTAAFSPEDSSSSSNLQSQPRQHQQLQQHPGNQGAAEGFITAAGTATDHKLLCQSSLPLTGQQLETKLREDVASLFSEFWSIPTNLTSRNQCGLAGVGQKNRYAGIIPNNETRVILPQTNNDELTTYINANYIHLSLRQRRGANVPPRCAPAHPMSEFCSAHALPGAGASVSNASHLGLNVHPPPLSPPWKSQPMLVDTVYALPDLRSGYHAL
ncbi:unnamed protein product [Schistocephalus solidus]|uniref:protein-tyrosine-phosphatase n=1 Tax=Schistocephalus solidus TaxID=70667 RepID=A0A183SQP0_SCHSO|nr:unnamed protein product [Schistocephalus solidus]